MTLHRLAHVAVRTVATLAAAAAVTVAVTATAAADSTGAYTDRTQPGGVATITFDSNGDGTEDVTALDQDANGVFEAMFYDSNADGDTEMWMYDDNQDGRFERYVLDQDNNGEMDVFVTDSDADQVPDAVLVDANLNGMDDREEEALRGTGALIGPPTNLDPVNALMLLLAAETGHAEFGTPDSDHDGYDDNHDVRPDDPYLR